MSKTVNLRQARKQRGRTAKQAEGAANAALHGGTKGERLAEEKAAEATQKHLDDHKRDET